MPVLFKVVTVPDPIKIPIPVGSDEIVPVLVLFKLVIDRWNYGCHDVRRL